MNDHRDYANNPGHDGAVGQIELSQAVSAFMLKVYNWMGVGLFLTGIFAFFVANNESAREIVLGNRLVFWVLIIAEFGLVIGISAGINKLSAATATALFCLYSILNGMTLSVIFLAYTSESLASTFFITGGTFAAVSVFGYVTKRDLTGVGHFMFMGLIGLVIASVVNIFLNSPALYWITTYVGVLIFTGLTAYDTQKLKRMGMASATNPEFRDKGAVLGALTLYLDFINLFLMLLRIFGNRK